MSEKPFDPSTLSAFTDGVPYLGQETGLYPGAQNTMPAAHQAIGKRLAATIAPLDIAGKAQADGRILGLVLGHSNCSDYFGALETHLRVVPGDFHPRFELVNAAVGGNQLPEIVHLKGPVWNRAHELMTAPGYSPQQVQVLFLHTTYHGWKNTCEVGPGDFPQHMQAMQRDLAKVLAHCTKLYPNLKMAYLTCDGLRHFTGFEPHVWREAFAFKWLIADQIAGRPGSACEGPGRTLPWLQWGPYIWDNTWDQRHFIDGVHPGPRGKAVFVRRYLDFLASDPVSACWLGKRPAAAKA